MEKRQLIAIIIITIMIIGFNFYQSSQYEEQVEGNQQVEEVEEPSSEIDTEEISVDELSNELDSTNTGFTERFVTITKDSVQVILTNNGAVPHSIELLNFTTFYKEPLILIRENAMKNGLAFRTRNGAKVLTSDLKYKVVKSGKDFAIFQSKLEYGTIVEVTYRFDQKYLDWDVRFIQPNKSLASGIDEVELDYTTDLYLAERDVKKERTLTAAYYKNEKETDNEGKNSDYIEKPIEGDIQWVSHFQQFFHLSLVFDESNPLQDYALTAHVPEDSTESNQFIKTIGSKGNLPVESLQSDLAYSFKFHIGANDYYDLKALGNGMERIVPIGSWGLQYVNGYLILPLFKFLEGFISNYGLIIFLLCIIVKLVLTPFTFKSYQSQAKMKVVQPLIKTMKEKYSGDTQKIQQETMKIYRKTGVSPLGGCLPMLLQLPILISMYRLFPAAIELRGKSFLWSTDLSAYDAVITFPTIPIIDTIYGSHVSVFTLLAAISVFFYSRYNMSQTATDDSNPMAANMKVIQNFFPIMMLIFFNKAASGLSFYYFVYNLTTFGQQYIIRRFAIDDEKLKEKISGNIKKNKQKGGGRMERFAKRMEEMQKQAGERKKEIQEKKKNQGK